MATKTEIGKALAILCSTYDRDLNEVLCQAYHIALEDVTDKQLTRAVTEAVKTLTFFPKPAELRGLVFGTKEDVDRRAELAFEVFDSAWRTSDYSLDFEDKAINATVRSLGGLVRAGEMKLDNYYAFFRRDFLRTYRTYCVAGVSPEAGAHLPGRYEDDNPGNPRYTPRRIRCDYSAKTPQAGAIASVSRLIEHREQASR